MKTKAPKNILTKKQKNPSTKDLTKFFIIFFLSSLFISAVYAAASGGEAWKYMLFHNGPYTDMYMDFFNSIRDAGAEDVYTARNNIYPPLCLLIFKLMGFSISESLVDLPNKNKTMLQLDQRSMMVYFLFACFCIILMTVIINAYTEKLTKKNDHKKSLHTVISYIMIVSYPVMYCIERGNIIILSMIFTMFFVFFRNSENKVVREISYILLALAAGIKLYPAIFGILLLLEKKYKDAARLIVYGLICILLPFVFFTTPETLSVSLPMNPITASISNGQAFALANKESSSALANIIENLLSFATKKKNRLNFSSVSIQNFVFIVSPTNQTLAKALCFITEGIALVSLFFCKKKWQSIFLISYLMLNIPSASSSYALTFLIIPFIMFLYDDEGNGYPANERPSIDWVYITFFALLFAPLPILWFFHQDAAMEIFEKFGLSYQSKINQLLAGFVFQGMFGVILYDIASNKFRRKKSKAINSDIDENVEVA